ncbi:MULTISPECIES: hypothetical protein [Helicobacter]|uniref:Uncharacterized protein n=1 Tax=Helicobacter bilis ATCC 43879 TaxID=613026 RepID=C3XIL8_9HELI|nr:MULTISPECIES: hypothetical protein [Helicobacter]EEO24857.1 hypothetical protein HRAG_01914 [Helicobacter bilis ATCC 43879]
MNSSYKEKYLSCVERTKKYKSISYKQWIQENKEKKMLEICFSYGNDMIRLQGVSRHSSDVNLHIITQGYSNGEEVEVRLESSLDKVFSVSGIIQDNQAIIMNIFKA